MKVPFIDLTAQYKSIQSEIDIALQAVFEGGQFVGGPFVADFERKFSSLVGVKYCVGVGNGTDGLFVALKKLGVSPGDEVITPAFGWISSAEMISLAGGQPIFADILPDTFTIDPVSIEHKIGPKTKGVVLIHLYGQAAHAHQIAKLCQDRGLFLLEDCAQAHLTQEFGIVAGNIGNAGAFSFYPTKNLGAFGDAGCIVTNDSLLEQSMRLYANHGGLQQHLQEGVNSRLDTLQAALLLVQMRHLTEWTARRIQHAATYLEHLKDIPQVTLPVVRQDTKHTFHQFVIRVQRRTALRDFLAERQIETMVHYPSSLPNLPAYQYLKHASDSFPVASRCQEEVLSLPVHPALSTDQISYVCSMISAFFKGSI